MLTSQIPIGVVPNRTQVMPIVAHAQGTTVLEAIQPLQLVSPVSHLSGHTMPEATLAEAIKPETTRPDHSKLIQPENTSIVFGSFYRYNTTNLFMVKAEINQTLSQIEQTFTNFAESLDLNQAQEHIAALDTAITQLHEIKGALDFLVLHGAYELACALIDLLSHFKKTLNKTAIHVLEYFAEGLMLLSRYCEFVQLREAVVPHLLLPITNKIRLYLQQDLIREGDFLAPRLGKAMLTLPTQPPNIMPKEQQDKIIVQLRPLFQYGLLGVLSNTPSESHFKAIERAVFFAYMLNGNHDSELFWHTAYCAIQQLQDCYPISDSRKRVLIAIEQQFKDIYQAAPQKSFIDVLAMGLCRDNESAHHLREQLGLTAEITTDLYANQLRGYIFGPTSETIFTCCSNIFELINTIKDHFVEVTQSNSKIEYQQIGIQMQQLAHTLRVVKLEVAAQNVLTQAQIVAGLQQEPVEEQVDSIMQSLLIAENMVARLNKSYTPGGVQLPLHNLTISQFQLDHAQSILVSESRNALKQVMSLLNNLEYQLDITENTAHTLSNDDVVELSFAPSDASKILASTGGALGFIEAKRAEKILKITAMFAAMHLNEDKPTPNHQILEFFATIISSIDYYLDGLLTHTPTGNHPFELAETCLIELEAA